jgi:spermidine/putrescine transport system permease protein
MNHEPTRTHSSDENVNKKPVSYQFWRRQGVSDTFLAIPTLVWIFFLIFLPLIFTVVISFASRDYYGKVEYNWNIDNYLRFLDPLYLRILIRSLSLGLQATLLCLLIGYPVAYVIARSPKNIKTILLVLVIAPFWTNLLIRAYAWLLILRNTGLINLFLQWANIIDEPLHLLYNDGAILTGLVYIFLPFMVLPLYTNIEKLDWDLLEAASDLGANDVHTFRNVTLPLTMPGIVAGSILVFVPAFGSFVIPAILGGAKSMMIGNLIENQFKESRNWPFGAATAVILIIFALVAIMIYVRWTRTGEDREIL